MNTHQQQGFTLLELAVVLAIVALLAAILITEVGTYDHTRLLACKAKADIIQEMEQDWQASQQTPNPDVALCRSINEKVDAYNASKACKASRELPNIECP